MNGTPTNSFADLLSAARDGSQTATEELFRRHYGRIVAIIRGRIRGKYRARIDAESVANAALKSLFRGLSGDRLALTDWDDLWNLLATIALRKLKNRYRALHREKRDVSREAGADPLDGVPVSADSPEDEATVADTFEAALAGYSERDRTIIEMSLQGYQIAEIAEATRVVDRTVKRVRADFRRRLEQMRDAGDE